MEFQTDTPIYRQIADYICREVLDGTRMAGDRLPSVRELGLTMGVNPHTVLKSYEELERNGIIAPKRGLGYFVSDDAAAKVRQIKKTQFFENTLPRLASTINALGIGIDELVAELKKLNPS